MFKRYIKPDETKMQIMRVVHPDAPTSAGKVDNSTYEYQLKITCFAILHVKKTKETTYNGRIHKNREMVALDMH